jgi:ABC-type sugar transport system permease subunit
VILPEIAPVTRFVMLLSLIGSLQLFELPFILLNGPGPEHRGLTVVMYLYQYGFEVGDLGYASAIGWTLALVLMGLTVIQRLLSREP